jgi:hypothetical protein
MARADPVSIAPWLLVALAIPRIVRMLYPSVWVEDDLLLESAFAVSKGLRPYLDFAHAQMPLLEWAAGLYIQVVGASHVRMELLNGAAIYATSVLLFFVARRAFDARVATAASLLYACHSLVFRYHVWAREFFVSALVLGAMLVVLDDPGRSRRRILLASALLCAACAIKLTAGTAGAAICLYMAFGMPARARAAMLALTIAAGFGAFVAFCFWRYGDAFVFQAFLFHFLKGVDTEGAGPSYILSLLDVLGPLSLLGLWHVARNARWNHAAGLAAAVLVAYLLFFGVLSPTAWGHNYLEAWPLVCLLAGVGIVSLVDATRTSWIGTAARIAIAAGCLLWITPIANESTLRGSVYGFGFVPRRELSAVAVGLRDGTGPADEVIAPSFIAFEANRLQAIRYPENYGVMKAGDELRRTAGFQVARERFGTRSFFDLINETSDIWNQEVIRAIAPGGRVHAVIPDSTIQLLPLVDASPAALSERGFNLALQTEHFTLWLRHADHASVHQRTTNVRPGGV